MLNEIMVNYHKMFPKSGILDKSDILKNLDNTFASLTESVIPTLEKVIEDARDLNIIKANKNLTTILKNCGLNFSDNRDGLIKLKTVLVNISKGQTNLFKLLDSILTDKLTDKTLTVKQAAGLKILDDITAITLFVPDFVYFVLTNNGTDENSELFNKKKVKEVILNTYEFNKLIDAYKDKFTNTIDDVYKVSDAEIYISDGKLSMLQSIISKAKQIKLPLTSGFVGNPLYLIRMWSVDRGVKKYEANKDKKRLVELKLAELRAKEAGGEAGTVKLQEQISYYENRLSDLEYKIRRFEEE